MPEVAKRELIEFHCNDCNGYFTVNLNLEIEGDFLFVCPNCGHEHPRTVKKGEMVGDVIERMYHNGEGKRAVRNFNPHAKERILVPKACYSKESRLKVIEPANRGFLAQAWARLAGNEKGG
jgi:hypothetical protein